MAQSLSPVRIETLGHQIFARLNREGLDQFANPATASQYWSAYQVCFRYLHSGWKVLDWGCGNGNFSYFLLRAGYRTTAFSLEPCPLAESLSTEFGDAFTMKRGKDDEPVDLPFQEGTFDAVVSMGVLEHVREKGGDESASLRELRRVLKPGGRFLCFHFPNRWSWIEIMSAWLPGKSRHMFRFSRKDIRRLCRDTGFYLEETGSYGFSPRNGLRYLPRGLIHGSAFVQGFNLLDRKLAHLLAPCVQNHFFVARRPPISG